MYPTTERKKIEEMSGKDLSQHGIVLDAYEAAQEKLKRSYYLNVIFIPPGRFLAFLSTAVAVLLNNRFILKTGSDQEFFIYLTIIILYSLISGLALRLFFTRVKFIHLGDFFFFIDIFIILLGIYLSGGEKSYLYPIIIAWVTDQASSSSKRVLGFTAIGISSYLLFICYLSFIEHRLIAWPVEFTKTAILCFIILFTAWGVRFTDKLRANMSKAIRIAREFILQLQDQTRQLEEARSKLETLYLREQEVSNALKELDQMKTNFLIVTSHEMRTPLTIIKGYNEAMLNQMFGSLTTTQIKSLETSQRAVDRLTITLEDILEMLKISEGKILLKKEEIDLPQILQRIIDELGPYIAKRKQKVYLEAPKHLTITADYARIHLIFLNLIQNAIKFTYDGGTIRIELEIADNSVNVTIADSGIGIESAEIEKIFEKFYINSDPSYHSSGTYEFLARGTGLGLSIAKSYVEAHGGKIWAESQGKKKGSTFRVVLPIFIESIHLH